MSAIRKRSLVIRGHRTSVTLEDAFWEGFCDCAARDGLSLGELAARVDAARMAAPEPLNLSSAIRLHVLHAARAQAGQGS